LRQLDAEWAKKTRLAAGRGGGRDVEDKVGGLKVAADQGRGRDETRPIATGTADGGSGQHVWNDNVRTEYASGEMKHAGNGAIDSFSCSIPHRLPARQASAPGKLRGGPRPRRAAATQRATARDWMGGRTEGWGTRYLWQWKKCEKRLARAITMRPAMKLSLRLARAEWIRRAAPAHAAPAAARARTTAPPASRAR
jgi:hypothetical protein